MRHVLICIRTLHKKAGYLHCDLRWPNIILVGSEWYVIDCTESIANNASLKDRLAVSSRIIENNFDSALPWSMRHDYYQLGMLIRNLDDVPNEYNEVAKKLCNKNIATINAEEVGAIAVKFKEKSRKKACV